MAKDKDKAPGFTDAPKDQPTPPKDQPKDVFGKPIDQSKVGETPPNRSAQDQPKGPQIGPGGQPPPTGSGPPPAAPSPPTSAAPPKGRPNEPAGAVPDFGPPPAEGTGAPNTPGSAAPTPANATVSQGLVDALNRAAADRAAAQQAQSAVDQGNEAVARDTKTAGDAKNTAVSSFKAAEQAFYAEFGMSPPAVAPGQVTPEQALVQSGQAPAPVNIPQQPTDPYRQSPILPKPNP
jgi:hypothetical protein